ncbi:MAG: phage major capsid protein [Clostridiales bacterium]|nr:phage major capsid protein [Clostridiales bacterium]
MKKIFESDLQMMSYAEAFNDMLRGRRLATDQVKNIQMGEVQSNTYRLPSNAETRFNQTRNNRSVMRSLCKVISVAQGDNRLLVSERDTEAKWLLPGEPYPTVETAFRQIRSQPKKLGCTSVISADIVHDNLFPIVDHLVDSWGRRFAQKEDEGIICGSGANGELSGLTQQATQMSISELSFASLLDVYVSVEPEFRDNAVWLVSDISYALIRALTDSSGRPLMDITSSGAQLLGCPVKVSLGCPDSALFFGDMNYIWILDRSPLMVQPLVELYAAQNQIAYHGWCLEDAVLVRSEAVTCANIITETETTETTSDEDETVVDEATE